MANTTTNKGFIKDAYGNILLPITRGELILDSNGLSAFHSEKFLATLDKPGLMTAGEKAMLNGSSGQGLSDIYTKLGYINSGLKFNGNLLKFYSETQATPINIIPDETFSIIPNGNTVTLGLNTITTTITGNSGIIKEFTVDNYGRVTSITKGTLINDDIPAELSGKKLSNSTLTGCTTEDLSTDANSLAIVNKNYVDTKFNTITSIASGGLKFSGSINSDTYAKSIISPENGINNVNKLYKVTANFSLDKTYIHDADKDTILIKIGDTLIVHKNSSGSIKFVHIPSGDEDVTLIGIREKDNADPIIENRSGNFTFIFDPTVIKVESSGNNPLISINQASTTTSGYLSVSDYNEFKQASSKSVSYTSTVINGTPGFYEIGKLKFDNLETSIYGTNTISELSLESGIDTTHPEYNPILKFTKSGSADLSITLKGTKGIEVKKSNNDIELCAKNIVESTSSNYLEITEGYKFNIKKGSVTDNNINDGITDYKEFIDFKSSVVNVLGNLCEVISNSLTDETKEYHYGSTKLIEAITLTI